MDLDSLRYGELQRLAKENGIKANMKAAKLLQALKDHFAAGENKENTSTSADIVKTDASTESGTSTEDVTPTKPKKIRKARRTKKSKKVVSSNIETERAIPNDGTPQPPIITPIVQKTPVSIEGNRPETPNFMVEGKKMTPIPCLIVEGIKMTPIPSAMKSGWKRKRTQTPEAKVNTTFEIENATPVDKQSKDESTKSSERQVKRRRRTFEIESAGTPESGVTDMVACMKPEMSSDQRKTSLMQAIEKKVQDQKLQVPTPNTSGSQIPRFAVFLAKKKQEGSLSEKKTPGNKNWAKIHQRNFEKMDSIDVYLAKKHKRAMSQVTASVKKAQKLVEQTKNAVESLKNQKTPTHKGAKIAKPVKSCTSLAFKSPAHKEVPFVPTVKSASNMNLNFSNLMSPAVFGKPNMTELSSSVKHTMERKSPRLNSETKENAARKSVDNSLIKSHVTPFKPNTTQQPSATKKAFDLKASLAKPVTWKVHTGKIKPWTELKNVDVKARKPQTKEDLHKAVLTNRAEKKSQSAMQRRGLVA